MKKWLILSTAMIALGVVTPTWADSQSDKLGAAQPALIEAPSLLAADGGVTIASSTASKAESLAVGAPAHAVTAGLGRRVALVMGNGAYVSAPALPSCINDARAVGEALERLGYEVSLALDMTQSEARSAIDRFVAALPGSESALFYFSGHGMQIGVNNYLLPVDIVETSEDVVVDRSINVTAVLRDMEAHDGVSIIVLDTSRHNPFGSPFTSGGLSSIQPAGNRTIIAYATVAGGEASNGSPDHGAFTEALLEHLEEPNVDVGTMFHRIKGDVVFKTGGRQKPELLTRLVNAFYMNPGTSLPSVSSIAPAVEATIPPAAPAVAAQISRPAPTSSGPTISADIPGHWSDCGEVADISVAIQNCSKIIESGEQGEDSWKAYLERASRYAENGERERAAADYAEAARLMEALASPPAPTVDQPAGREPAAAAATTTPAPTVEAPAISPAPVQATADLGRRIALVVANAVYEDAPLQNPTVDAGLIEPVLKQMGFSVTVVKDADLETFARALDSFYTDAKGADLALFYFAGHGFAVNGQLGAENYLMSTSARVTSGLDIVIRSGGISLDEIIASITDTAKVSLIFVDACRNDPRVSRGAGGGRGLARIADVATEELFVGLSTRLGDLAEDGKPGAGSPFARAFAKSMPAPNLPIDEAFRQLRLAVVEETSGRQRPEARDDLNSELVVVEADN